MTAVCFILEKDRLVLIQQILPFYSWNITLTLSQLIWAHNQISAEIWKLTFWLLLFDCLLSRLSSKILVSARSARVHFHNMSGMQKQLLSCLKFILAFFDFNFLWRLIFLLYCKILSRKPQIIAVCTRFSWKIAIPRLVSSLRFLV